MRSLAVVALISLLALGLVDAKPVIATMKSTEMTVAQQSDGSTSRNSEAGNSTTEAVSTSTMSTFNSTTPESTEFKSSLTFPWTSASTELLKTTEPPRTTIQTQKPEDPKRKDKERKNNGPSFEEFNRDDDLDGKKLNIGKDDDNFVHVSSPSAVTLFIPIAAVALM
ncbi:hypothetical protein L596_010255 [Steinernema carpocapsae]|uniref:Uncharacterized protein n=1 Tax=Steinernema carpocapsae TaxID=34508 RepID=A0A4U5PI26_STECR|nr:hypothetical protein L596_010255 [Steinernema carpocapsae]